MVEKQRSGGFKEQVKGPLIIAVVLAVVAFFGVFIFATGGTQNAPQYSLSLSVAGAVFIVTLVLCATLMMIERPNDEHLGQGTGINRSSAKLYAEAKAKREAEARKKAVAERATGTADSATGTSAASSTKATAQQDAASDSQPRANGQER